MEQLDTASGREDPEGKGAVLAWRTKRGNTTDLIYSSVPYHRRLLELDGDYTSHNFALDGGDIEGL